MARLPMLAEHPAPAPKRGTLVRTPGGATRRYIGRLPISQVDVLCYVETRWDEDVAAFEKSLARRAWAVKRGL